VLRPVLILAGAAVLAGCGSSHKGVAVPAYGDHPATTVTAAPADPVACRNDAGAFADAAKDFLAHSGSKAAYPADLWLVLIRDAFADFQARGCDPALVKLPKATLRKVADGLPASLADAVSETFGLRDSD
jgi:hypothetical protein